MAPCLLLALHSAWVLQQAARPAYSCGAKRPHRRSPPAALAPGTARAPSAAPRRRRCVALRAMEGGLEPAMLRSGLSAVEDRLDALISSSEPAANLELRLQDLELLSTAPGFWEDQRTAQATMAQITECASRLQRFKRWAELRTDAAEAVEALRGAADDEEAAYYALEAQRVIETLEGDATSLELELVMSGPYDGCACRLEIQAGAGGDDAQDWTAMLIRMYTRFAERRGFSCAQVDLAEGDYPGTVKAATLEIVGSNAYGLLRSEKGAHRLVRISPFNSAGKRQTSFAAVFPSPIVDQTHPARAKDVDLVAKDLDVQTMRSGGAGGQNVNKVETAVRVRHVPTGLAVKCSIHRTQLENKAAAMDMLRGKLLAAMDEQRAGELDDLRGDRVMADFGGSIRTYFLHPYKMVKDAKSGHETAAALDVLDGDLGPFVDAALRHRAAEAAAAALEEAPLP